METIIGNKDALSLLYEAARTEKPAGCYVIAGEEGSGKRSIARLGAAAFCCENRRGDGSPCLLCRNCQNVLNGTHVDVQELTPEKDKKFIPVEDVRAFLRASYLSPVESDWRAYIIDAFALNPQGQNALLKSIEEVRPRSVFFLLATDLSALLPTVRSRSVILRTEALDPAVIRSALSCITGKSEKLLARAEIAAALSGGSLGKARKLLTDQHFFDKRDQVLSYFDAVAAGSGFTRLCSLVPPATANRQDYTLFLTMAKLSLRDLLCRSGDPDAKPLLFPDDDRFADLASVTSPARASRLFALTEELLADAENANVFTALSRFHREAQGLTKPD